MKGRLTEPARRRGAARRRAPAVADRHRALAPVEGNRLYFEDIQRLTQSGGKIAAGLIDVPSAIREATQAQDPRENDRLSKAVEALNKQTPGRP